MLQLTLYQLPSQNQFSVIEFFGSLFNFSPFSAWFLAGLTGVVFVSLSFILSYHWKKFGLEPMIMARAGILYFAVSGFLIAVMVISLILYTFN